MDIGKDLTKRQQEIFDFIKRYSARYGYPPTVRDIGKAVGLASSSTVHAHLANLEKVGMLRRDPSKPRAIELLDRATATATSAVDAVKSAVMPTGIPVLGRVAAGEPLLAEENIEDYVQIPDLAGGEDGEYLLQVRGDSMKNAGILPGDYVTVKRQDTARGRRDRRRAGGGGGDGQALLQGGRPRAPAAGERDDGADPHARGRDPRPRRRRAAEGRIMSALMAERRELGEEGRQESLFEALAPPRAPARANPWPRRRAATPLPTRLGDRAAGGVRAAARGGARRSRRACDALVDEPFAAPATEEVGERRVPRTAGMPLAGPTLDDVMSRVWEGLATGLPAACPVCHGEVEPALGGPLSGRCRSCGTAID